MEKQRYRYNWKTGESELLYTVDLREARLFNSPELVKYAATVVRRNSALHKKFHIPFNKVLKRLIDND